MTDVELIALASELDDSGYVRDCIASGEDGILASLEMLWGHGLADEQSGNASDGPGHVYRLDRWTVETNTQGDHDVTAYETEDLARAAFVEIAAELQPPWRP